jgi:hypothetical protein
VRAERFLQAEVFDASNPSALVRLQRGFRRDAWHRLAVTIAPRRKTSLRGEGPSFDEAVGGHTDELLLDFVFNAIGAVPQEQALQLKSGVRLPVGGSASVEFDFRLLPGIAEVRIELEVRVGQRTIQPATLVGPAADDPAVLPRASEIRFLRGRPLAQPAFAASRASLDGVISVGGASGDPVVTTVGTGRAPHLIDTAKLRPATLAFEQLLDSIVTDERTIPRRLDDESVRDGLYKLALRGAQLYDAVGRQIVRALGADASRIQLLLRSESVVLPLELVYDLPAPARGATVCANWKRALKMGFCNPEHHGTAPDGNAAVICPSGFWAVSKLIERQLAPEALFTNDRASFDVAAQSEPSTTGDSLPLLRGAVYAASGRVEEKNSIRLAKTLARAVSGSKTATSWQQWRREIKRTRASLLVLLSHTINDDTGWALQIGDSDNLYVAQVTERYVSTAKLPLIALLLGCETAENPEEFQSFVARFRSKGASLVIGTVCGVLGNRAPVVAAEIVRHLAAAAARQRPTTAGAVIQQVRRTLLEKGELTALALATYGDIDWKITSA